MSSLKKLAADRLERRQAMSAMYSESFDAKSFLIRGENDVKLNAVKCSYYKRFLPNTIEQRALVDMLIHADWLLRRVRVVEAELWDDICPPCVPIRGDLHLGKAYRKHADLFARLQRRIDSTQRNYRNALLLLEKLLAREAAEQAAADAEAAEQNQSVTPEIGFVPQFPPQPPAEARPNVPRE